MKVFKYSSIAIVLVVPLFLMMGCAGASWSFSDMLPGNRYYRFLFHLRLFHKPAAIPALSFFCERRNLSVLSRKTGRQPLATARKGYHRFRHKGTFAGRMENLF